MSRDNGEINKKNKCLIFFIEPFLIFREDLWKILMGLKWIPKRKLKWIILRLSATTIVGKVLEGVIRFLEYFKKETSSFVKEFPEDFNFFLL